MALRVGVVGLRRGRGPLSVLAHHPEAEVVAAADLNEDARRQAAEAHGLATTVETFEELLTSGIEAVVIATPAPLHARQAITALDAGIHVLSEVPAVYAPGEAEDLVAAVGRSTASYMFAENVNFFDRTVAWQQFIAAGNLGEIFYGEAEYIHSIPSLRKNPDGSPTWRAHMAPIQYCTHSLGPLLAWSGDRVVSVIGQHTGSHCDPEFGSLDLELALCRTARGALYKVMCGFSLQSEPGRHYYCVYGTKGMLESGRTNDSPDRGYLAGHPETAGPAPNIVPPAAREAPEYASVGGHGTSEWFMIDAWLRSVIDGTPPPIDVHTGLDMTLPGLYAHQSALQGGVALDVPDSRSWVTT